MDLFIFEVEKNTIHTQSNPEFPLSFNTSGDMGASDKFYSADGRLLLSAVAGKKMLLCIHFYGFWGGLRGLIHGPLVVMFR